MENIKFGLFSIIILALLLFVGYWAFQNMESGSSHLANQELKNIKQENIDLKEENKDLKNKITILQSESAKEPVEVEIKQDVVVETPKQTQVIVLKHQDLIDELQKLIDGNIYMKKGSKGPRVGTIQNFLNLYNKTSNRIDNDFGPTLEASLKKFQTAEKLTPDGQVGPSTYKRMIDWLKKQ